MAQRFQDILAVQIRRFPRQAIIVKNVDGFLGLPEVKALLELHDIQVFTGSNIAFRIHWELQLKAAPPPDEKVLFISERPGSILEDISHECDYYEFSLSEFFPELHINILLDCHLELLDFLYAHKPNRRLGKADTLKYILEHYYQIDADNFSSREIVIIKWMDFYQRGLPIDEPVKHYFLEGSRKQIATEIVANLPALLQYLQEEWKKYGEGQEVSLDFQHPQLKQQLSHYFFSGWLTAADDPTGQCKDIGIPYASKQDPEAHTQEELVGPIQDLLKKGKQQDWFEVAVSVSQAIRRGLSEDQYTLLSAPITAINDLFQEHLEAQYWDHLVPSNPYKRPKVVNKVLDHLNARYTISEKIALVVIDGLAWWQYQLLRDQFQEKNLQLEEQVVYSWIPSITYLSRQALFRGRTPDQEYIQNPRNEGKLWESYWTKQQVPASMIRYDYEALNPNGLSNISRLALVYTELDEKMHASSDYQDLFDLTMNWMARSGVGEQFRKLKEVGFTIYLTSDHGNVQASGWRNLSGREKFGTSKSRSRRHLEYAEGWLVDEFLMANPELIPKVGRTANTLYLRDDRSFSNRETEVTHGGSHFLEVLVPWVRMV